MIKFLFSKGEKFFYLTIKDMKIYYYDNVSGPLWGNEPIQYLPVDPRNFVKIITSRGKIPAYFKEVLTVPQSEIDEYNAAKTEEDLKNIILKDAATHNCKLIDMKVEE